MVTSKFVDLFEIKIFFPISYILAGKLNFLFLEKRFFLESFFLIHWVLKRQDFMKI